MDSTNHFPIQVLVTVQEPGVTYVVIIRNHFVLNVINIFLIFLQKSSTFLNCFRRQVENFQNSSVVDECHEPLLISGQITYNDSMTSPYHYPLDTMASFSCYNGYSLSGPISSICLMSEEWSEQPPTCNLSNKNTKDL